MKLYTRTGDSGETGLFGGQRVSKSHQRVIAYGEVDELNSALGVARTLKPWPELDQLLVRIQHELFDLGAHLATPHDSPNADKLPQLDESLVSYLESQIDRATEQASPLTAFILPSGSRMGAWLLYARCICRRAERESVALSEREDVNVIIVHYLNRLSDLLFALGREANARDGVPETIWHAGVSGGDVPPTGLASDGGAQSQDDAPTSADGKA